MQSKTHPFILELEDGKMLQDDVLDLRHICCPDPVLGGGSDKTLG